MSVRNPGIILFSSFLIFGLAPVTPARQTPTYEKTTPQKETTQKPTTSTEAGKATTSDHHKSEMKHGKMAGQLSKEEVREIQTALKDAGFDPGPIDGIMGRRTSKAIRDFQYDNGILATGKVDDETLSTLGVEEPGTAVASLEEASPFTERPLPETSVEPAQPDLGLESDEGREKPQARTETRMETKVETADKDRDAKHAGKEDKDVAERVRKAADVLQELTRAEDRRIPNELLERAEAVAVIPNMVKGAFAFGGRYGKGVVSKRLTSGRWSPPAFIEIGGGSFGAQIGVSSTDVVLVFTDSEGLRLLTGGRELKLGADAAVAAGPIGRSAEAGVTGTLKSGIYAYSRSKGLFAGVALDGAVLDIDNSANRKIYGESAQTEQILNGNVTAKSSVMPFMNSLERVMPKKKISQK